MSDSPYVDDIEAARSLYFDYLCMLVRADEENKLGLTYRMLCRVLHETEFYSLVPHDENRAAYARELRDRFYEMESDAGYFHPLDALDIPCSCLEMMIGLAETIEDNIFYGSDLGITSVTLFWEMVENLLVTGTIGIGENDAWIRLSDEEMGLNVADDVRRHLEILLERTYERNGFGGLFPLSNPRQDQRKVELWYQANTYVMENYRF